MSLGITYDADFAQYETPYDGGGHTELRIPFEHLPVPNQFPKGLAPMNATTRRYSLPSQGDKDAALEKVLVEI